LLGKPINDPILREMSEIAATKVDPMDDNCGSAEYKREMVKVLVPRAAYVALQRTIGFAPRNRQTPRQKLKVLLLDFARRSKQAKAEPMRIATTQT
jgi:hypothetical protein